MTMKNAGLALQFKDIESAAKRLRGHAVMTPLVENDELNRLVSARVLIKPETLQHTGSFKFRGAYNRMSRLSAAEKKAGVVAWSSGNHAQGVASVAAKLGIVATIVMPSDAPRLKVEGVKAFGGIVRPYDRYSENREEIGTELARKTGAVIVPPYDDPHIIAGQGTVGLEIAYQASERKATVDLVLVPCSGGGLVAGTATAIRTLVPTARVFSVEPAGFDDTARSLASGTRERNDPAARSFCDALLLVTPGELTFPVNRRMLAGGLVVTDAEVEHAMRITFGVLKLVVEPGGAVALAALLAGKIDVRDRTIAIVLSGGNVDPALFARVIGS